MTKTKLLLGIGLISLIYTGCGEQESPKEMVKKEVTAPEVKVEKEVIEEKAEVIEEIVEKQEVVQEEIVTPMVKKVQTIVSTPNAQTTFQKCSACHGQKAEKKALSKSAVIKDWSAAQIEEALKGYKNGTYGGAMKGLMKSQVNAMSDDEITALSQYITTLNK